MKREIVINASALEVRVALLEDGSLTELYLERQQHRGLAGNIYKGKVTRVLPGMQAAFVDIGLEKAGFLHVSDFHDDVQAVGSIAEVIGEDDVETYPVDDDAGDEAETGRELQDQQDQEVRDLQELAELEQFDEPALERQSVRRDDSRQDDSRPDRLAERQAPRANVRPSGRQTAQAPHASPEARREAHRAAQENAQVETADMGDDSAASAEGEDAAGAAPAAAGEAGAPATKRRRRRRRRGGKAHKRRPRVHEQRSRLPIEQQLHRNQEIIVQ
ncbi:MAG TPA: S1 RNA-binding domain-containing protein, partial [Candidatus Binataceae bacterium]|nr:S1 RNA-binding domain-containing protein [Candidatus Binataceae bacterium]